MSINKFLLKGVNELGLNLPMEILEELEVYSNELIKYNKKVNLTAVTNEDEIAVKHFVDSLSLLKYCNFPKGAKVIDVGTGGGFPGMVLKIARNDLRLTLIDGKDKKLEFLRELSSKLQKKVEILHMRSEELAKYENYRNKFDIVTARAVAKLSKLCHYTLPFLNNRGTCILMKGPDPEEEINLAKDVLNEYNAKIKKVEKFSLINDQKRSLIFIKKY